MSIFNTVLQSAALSIVSNILAQVIDAYQKNIPLSLNITPILQFVTYSILNTPLNCLWQDFIEASFPSNVATDVEVPNKTDEKAKALQRKKVFSVKNTLIKFALDQTLGAAVNIPLFIVIIGVVKGQSMNTITNNVKAVSLMVAM
ncbi:integral membrane protein [Venturia nashicola]|nr:integral membrane protein [Venturia nashicola]